MEDFRSDWLEAYQVERFWGKVNKESGQGPNGECWEWTAGWKGEEGYGGYYIKQINNTVACHKIAFLLVHNFYPGDIDEDLVVRHTCDNPKCCNPKHLRLGTFKSNSQDMVRAGHSVRGARNSKAKITMEIARQIRLDWLTGSTTYNKLSGKYLLSASTVRLIVLNKMWKDDSYIVPDFTFNLKKKYAKITDEDVVEIKKVKKEGVGTTEIMNRFNISMSQVYNILSGRQRRI